MFKGFEVLNEISLECVPKGSPIVSRFKLIRSFPEEEFSSENFAGRKLTVGMDAFSKLIPHDLDRTYVELMVNPRANNCRLNFAPGRVEKTPLGNKFDLCHLCMFAYAFDKTLVVGETATARSQHSGRYIVVFVMICRFCIPHNKREECVVSGTMVTNDGSLFDGPGLNSDIDYLNREFKLITEPRGFRYGLFERVMAWQEANNNKPDLCPRTDWCVGGYRYPPVVLVDPFDPNPAEDTSWITLEIVPHEDGNGRKLRVTFKPTAQEKMLQTAQEKMLQTMDSEQCMKAVAKFGLNAFKSRNLFSSLEQHTARFGPPLHEDFICGGFNPKRCNIAFVGTQDTGKSTFANLLLGGVDEKPLNAFRDTAKKHVKKIIGGEEVHASIESLEKIRIFFAKSGLGTTWEMVRQGQSKQDIDAWFPGGTFWDLPGIELADQGVQNYVHHLCLNHFDLVILLCEKQLSTDDFQTILFTKNAILNGNVKPGGVPLFVVRSKTDLAFSSHFDQFIRRGGYAARYEVSVVGVSGALRDDMLVHLNKSNENVAKIDPWLTMTTIPPAVFFFSGFPHVCAKHTDSNVGLKFPAAEAIKIEEFFRLELTSLRQKIFRIALAKCEGEEMQKACAFGSLVEATSLVGPSVKSPKTENIEIETDPGMELGFGVEIQRTDVDIIEPEEGEDRRADLGIIPGDCLEQFPLNELFVDVEEEKLLDELKERTRNQVGKFCFLISRKKKVSNPSFAGSLFKRKWHVSDRVDEEVYERAVETLVTNYAKDEGFPVGCANALLRHLRQGRPADPSVAQMARYDWVSDEVMTHMKTESCEFCSMVCRAIRKDEEGEVLDAAIRFLIGFRQHVVRHKPTGLSVRAKTDHAAAAEQALPDFSYRGTSMPVKEAEFYQEGLDFRVPAPFTTGAKKTTADAFMRRSHEKDNTRRMVLFVIDLSEMPGHVNFVSVPGMHHEEEYLFVPYSRFRVTQRVEKEIRNFVEKHLLLEIHLKAFKDNKDPATEKWPLAKWY